MGKYNKTCVYCGNTYSSDSRNQRYCSDVCCAKAQEKNIKIKKTRARKRRAYDENREINQALSQAYSLAHKTADLFEIPKICVYHLEGRDVDGDECCGQLQLHHIDGNPFNNAPWNLVWVCNHHHSEEHSKMKDINIVDVYATLKRSYSGKEEPYLFMVSDFQRIIENARNVRERIE